MAVYTKLATSQMEQLSRHYALESLVSFQEISAGIENTNYFLDTYSQSGGSTRWVLTIFENLAVQELPFFCALTAYLGEQGFKVPAPLKASDGAYISEVQGKPALVVNCLSGASVDSPNLQHCREVAGYLAKIHLALQDFSQERALVRGGEWMSEQRELLAKSDIEKEDLQLLDRAIKRYQNEYREKLLLCPQGIVHGDLFRDNVLFEGETLSGVIDFYHACQATLLFDLAVLINDWVWDASLNAYDMPALEAVLESYQAFRTFTDEEHQALFYCLELAALRFWISRLVSFHLPGYQQHGAAGDTAKDPDEMKAILLCAQGLSLDARQS
jgi:homoserine kinase type II